jgi:ubiquinone/menaquinone biosynthesis C-methylase UbiE
VLQETDRRIGGHKPSQILKVITSDANTSEINNRFQRDNITHGVFPAENANIQDNCVNLITVPQAVHWFDFERFYREVRRVDKRNGIIAVWSYGMHKIDL